MYFDGLPEEEYNMGCNKIPALIEINDYDGDYAVYEQKVYEIYDNTFGKHEYEYQGKKVIHKKYPEFQDKPSTFWHIISEGECEEERQPNLERYARIAWPAFILSECMLRCSKLLIWENHRKGKTRVLLWCQDIDYLVVLDKRKDYYLFWTAYPVTRKHTKVKLQKEYDNYLKNI